MPKANPTAHASHQLHVLIEEVPPYQNTFPKTAAMSPLKFLQNPTTPFQLVFSSYNLTLEMRFFPTKPPHLFSQQSAINNFYLSHPQTTLS
jgi:hypothetical protein